MNASKSRVLTIDGGEATGTSTAARSVAKALGIDFLDSGSLYRTFAYEIWKQGIDPDDAAAVEELAKLSIPRISVISGCAAFGGRVMRDEIRTPEIGRIVPKVSKLSLVRRLLIPAQRTAMNERGLVAEGRDMGTVIFPDAVLKVFLTATLDERARRRRAQFAAQGREVPLADVRRDIVDRDRMDSERTESPMRAAEDAITIETDSFAADQVSRMIVDMWRSRVGGASASVAGGS